MRVLFVTAEVSPIAKTGGLGDVCGSLPKALRKLGHEVIVFMPMYRQAKEWLWKNNVHPEPVASVRIAWADWIAEVTYYRTVLPGSDIPLYLVGNDFLFDRPQLYSPREDGYDDYLERFTVFCRAVIRGVEGIGFAPDIVHAHDWHTALLPVYLHSGLRASHEFRHARSVYTIHNLNYQGIAGAHRWRHLGLHSRYWAPDALEHFGDVNPMKGGILLSDQVTTVSPNYAREIRTPQHGAGLDGVLRAAEWKLTGILNGIDVEEWNPAADPLIDANYEPGRMHGKTICKRMLAGEAGLKYKPKTPLIGAVSRLVDQKGFQLAIPVLEKLLAAGAQFVLVGTGDPWLENALENIAAKHPDSCHVRLSFDVEFARRVYAGSDMMLIPSLYEPCGLNQMYALRYDTVPVVRLTGGLKDTVIPFEGTNGEEANGFGFVAPSPADLYLATWLGMLNYRDSRTWKGLQTNGMAADFSWERSARQYEEVYRRAGSA